MQKLPLRPLRLVRYNGDRPRAYIPDVTDAGEPVFSSSPGADALHHQGALQLEKPKNMLSNISTTQKLTHGDDAARDLLKRTPNNYLFNQIYGLWLYVSLFLLTLLITHNVSSSQYGIYAAIQTIANTINYIIAFGLEDAVANFVPGVYAQHGRASAANLLRRILTLRVAILIVSTCVILFGLPYLAALITLIPLKGASQLAASFHSPVVLTHLQPIIIFAIGTGVLNLLMAVCAAVMRMHIVLIISSTTQFVLLAVGFLLLRMGLGIDGVLWTQAIVTCCSAAAFVIWLSSLIFARGATYKQPLKPILQLGISAWFTNLVTGALLKQVALILLSLFVLTATNTAIGYFNLSYQMADAANVLLVAGFSGVGGAALAAAFVGNNKERLARSWQALIKVETLLAAPGLVFCLFNASNIIHVLYGSRYESVGPLLVIFLLFNIFVRIIGTTIHQSSLYVVGKARFVVLSQWVSLLAIILLGIALIPTFGPAGALVADGVARAASGILLLLFLLPILPRKYPLQLLGFTLRFLCALIIAALPSILWHPTNSVQLLLSGLLFLLLCVVLLLLIKPLNTADLEMLASIRPKIAHYLRWFARKA